MVIKNSRYLQAVSLDVNPDEATGITIKYEGTLQIKYGIKLGYGADLQFPRTLKNNHGNFNFTDVFGFIKIPIQKSKKVSVLTLLEN